jgi:hypothetical protein
VDERAVTCARRRSPVVGTCEPESSDGLGIAHREVEVPGRHIKGAHSERSATPALFRRRWPNRCALSGSVRPTGGRPVFMFKASLARPRAGSGSVFRTCSAGDLGFNLRRSRPGAWASPAASERASHEVPGCGQAPVAVSLAAWSDLGPPRRPKSDPRRPSGSPAMPRSEDRWRPACRRFRLHSRRTTFRPHKDTKEPGPDGLGWEQIRISVGTAATTRPEAWRVHKQWDGGRARTPPLVDQPSGSGTRRSSSTTAESMRSLR